MKTLSLRVERRELLRGCSAGLSERTALIRLAVDGDLVPGAHERILTGVLTLCPDIPLFGVTESDWPAAFLVGEAAGGREGQLGDWVVAVTIALLRWSGDPVWRGNVVAVQPGRAHLAIPWLREWLLDEALELALRLIEQWAQPCPDGAELQRLTDYYRRGRSSVQSFGLPPITARFIWAAAQRGIPVDVMPGYVQLGWGVASERIDVGASGRTGLIATLMAQNRVKARLTLAGAGLPVPEGGLVHDVGAAERLAARLGWPVVVKPAHQGGGDGVVPGIRDQVALRDAFAAAVRVSPDAVLVEKHIDGDDHRLLVVNGTTIAAARRTGDSAVDVTAQVHPDNRRLAERAARIVGLDIAGVNVVTADISRSWLEIGGAVCDVAAQPGFRAHWDADPERDINGEIIDMMFAGRSGRIPTAAITGTNGKTTTAAMLYHIWTTAGAFCGLATSPVVMAGPEIASTRHLAGLPGGRMQLLDPGTEVAIIEMPRKGLIYLGHPCDRYEVAALINVQDDHIGVDGIDTLQQMAELKAEVLQRATVAVVINADDPLCMSVRGMAGTDRHILVARDAGVVAGHRATGGEAVFTEQLDGGDWIVLANGDRATPLMPLHDIPATVSGIVRVNESNAMFAAAMAWAQGVGTETIRAALGSFHGSAEQNPGRYNFFDGLPFQLVLDFGHNPEGVREICAVARALPIAGRRFLLTQRIGARHAAHYQEVAPDLAETFDEMIVSCDATRVIPNPEYAGEDPVAIMLARSRQAIVDAGADPDRVSTEADAVTAIHRLLGSAGPGDLVVLLAHPYQALPIIEDYRSRFSPGP